MQALSRTPPLRWESPSSQASVAGHPLTAAKNAKNCPILESFVFNSATAGTLESARDARKVVVGSLKEDFWTAASAANKPGTPANKESGMPRVNLRAQVTRAVATKAKI